MLRLPYRKIICVQDLFVKDRNAAIVPRFPFDALCENSKSGLQPVHRSGMEMDSAGMPASIMSALFAACRSRWY